MTEKQPEQPYDRVTVRDLGVSTSEGEYSFNDEEMIRYVEGAAKKRKWTIKRVSRRGREFKAVWRHDETNGLLYLADKLRIVKGVEGLVELSIQQSGRERIRILFPADNQHPNFDDGSFIKYEFFSRRTPDLPDENYKEFLLDVCARLERDAGNKN